MTLRLNGSTSGYTEIDAPAVAGSNTLVLPTGNGSSGQYLQTNGSGALSWAGGGKILQVVQTVKTDTFTSGTVNTWTDITGMSASITPSSSSSKILIMVNCGLVTADNNAFLKVLRGSTDIYLGDSAGTRTRSSTGDAYNINVPFSFCYLDSPATASSTTYKIQYWMYSSGTFYFNRLASDTDNTYRTRTASSITLMEVAA